MKCNYGRIKILLKHGFARKRIFEKKMKNLGVSPSESDRGKIAIKEKKMKVLFTARGKDRLLLAPVIILKIKGTV